LESHGMMNQMPDMRDESMPMEMMQQDQMPPDMILQGTEQMPPQGMPQ